MKKLLKIGFLILCLGVNTYGDNSSIDQICDNITSQQDIGAWDFIKKNFPIPLLVEATKRENSLFNLVRNHQNKDFRWPEEYGKNTGKISFYENMWESIWVEVSLTTFFKVMEDILDDWGISLSNSPIYKVVTPKNYRKKTFVFGEEDVANYKKILELMKLSTSTPNMKSVVYIYGPPGIGKTNATINELIKNGFTIYYINANNIIFGNYKKNISDEFSQLLKEITKAQQKNKKIIIMVDECEVIIANREHKYVGSQDFLSNILVKNRILLEQALTRFFLYILSQRQVSVILISNPCEDENGNLNIDAAMSRRFHYIFQMQLPNLKNLIKLWEFYLKAYKIKIIEGNQKEMIYFLSDYSHKNHISARTIGQITQIFQNRTVSVKEILSLLTIK